MCKHVLFCIFRAVNMAIPGLFYCQKWAAMVSDLKGFPCGALVRAQPRTLCRGADGPGQCLHCLYARVEAQKGRQMRLQSLDPIETRKADRAVHARQANTNNNDLRNGYAVG